MGTRSLRQIIAVIALLLAATMLLAGCGSDDSSSKSVDKDTTSESSSDDATTDDAADDAADAATDEEPASGGGTSDKQWDSPPKMIIDKNKTYTATLTTTKGAFTIELDAKKAPNAVNNFVFLAREKFYTNVPFHRIVAGFVIQTGDPTGTGTGGPGYTIKDDPGGTYARGTVAMANTGAPNSGGSQFFVSLDELSLPPTYALFGKVTKGMDVVDKIADTPVEQGDGGEMSSPTEKVLLKSVTITES